MKKLFLLLGMLSIPVFSAVSANVGFASDYIWRGMTQSDGPAMSGGFDYESQDGFYAGVWGSNVNFGNGTGSELDYYAGYATQIGDVDVDIGYLVFDYPDSTPDAKFEEIYLNLSFGDLGFLYAYGQDNAPNYTEISYDFGPVSFSFGEYDDYGDNFAISYSFTCGDFDCGFAYTDFSDGGYGADEDAIVFSASASL